jgi:hypothetical protein
MDVGGHDPEIVTLVEESVQLAVMPNPAPVFVVQEHRGAVVRADLVEGVPGKIFVVQYVFTPRTRRMAQRESVKSSRCLGQCA